MEHQSLALEPVLTDAPCRQGRCHSFARLYARRCTQTTADSNVQGVQLRHHTHASHASAHQGHFQAVRKPTWYDRHRLYGRCSLRKCSCFPSTTSLNVVPLKSLRNSHPTNSPDQANQAFLSTCCNCLASSNNVLRSNGCRQGVGLILHALLQRIHVPWEWGLR